MLGRLLKARRGGVTEKAALDEGNVTKSIKLLLYFQLHRIYRHFFIELTHYKSTYEITDKIN